MNAYKNWLNLNPMPYDQNGNVTMLNNATLGYDMENRLNSYTSGTLVENYAYDEGNRRVEKYNTSGADTVYFYGPNGKLLSVLTVQINASAPLLTLKTSTNRIYFGRMLLGTSTGYAIGDGDVIKDRLGSAKPPYPYGTDIGAQTIEGDDFATYWKDYTTGFQYAMNRYYSASYGRFLTVDPFGGSAHPSSPLSWNRYQYASSDPINMRDPHGLTVCDSNGDNCYDEVTVNADDDADDDGDSSFWGSICTGNSVAGNPFMASICEGLSPFNSFGYHRPALTFSQRAYLLASGYQGAVEDGTVTDCQGLADFADDVAATADSTSQFVSAFGVLTPPGGSNVPFTGIAWNTKPVSLLTPGETSGYATQYQNTLPDDPTSGWNGDQGHHFAAFFQFGYVNGGFAGSSMATILELWQGFGSTVNQGDIALGKFAARLGAEVKAGTISASAVGQQISSTLCNP